MKDISRLQSNSKYIWIILIKEMPDASVNIRKKLLFNEVKGLNYIIFDGNILRSYPDIDINYHQTVSPEPNRAESSIRNTCKHKRVYRLFYAGK